MKNGMIGNVTWENIPSDVRPTKTQISLHIPQIRKLIWIFAGRTCADPGIVTCKYNSYFVLSTTESLPKKQTCSSSDLLNNKSLFGGHL